MRPLLGTLVEIRATGSRSCLTGGIAAAFAAIERVQHLMSYHDEASDVARINAAPTGCELSVDRDTYRVLRCARELQQRSDGAFDIAIAPSLVAAGFLPHPPLGAPLPEPGTGAHATAASGADLELLAGCAVRWRRKGWIDLGGIAKGYAVDAAIEALRSHRVAHGLVNAGGDLRCFGESVPIQLRSPQRPSSALIAIGRLREGAIATSAGYFSARRVASQWLDPMVDPARRRCVGWNASISVLASHCMTADALTKVVRLAPASLPGLLEHYDAQALVVDELGVRSCGRARLQRDAEPPRLPARERAVA